MVPEAAAGRVIPTHADQERGPATFQQRQIYFHLMATGASYLIPFEWALGPLSAEEINGVLAAAPELRTVFELAADGALRQRVLPVAPQVAVVEAGVLGAWQASVQLDVHVGPVFCLAQVVRGGQATGRLVGLAHHLVTDGLGLEVLRQRLEERSAVEQRPSYLDYARWQAAALAELEASGSSVRPDLEGLELTEFAVAGSEVDADRTTTWGQAWPAAWQAQLQQMEQPRRFPWLLQRVMQALSRFTTKPDGEMVVASTVGNRGHVALDSVGCMVSTVLYRWHAGMGEAEWFEHVVAVQSQAVVPLEALKLPVHPASRLPLTEVMVAWHDARWWSFQPALHQFSFFSFPPLFFRFAA